MYPLHDRAEGAQGELGDFEELLTINIQSGGETRELSQKRGFILKPPSFFAEGYSL